MGEPEEEKKEPEEEKKDDAAPEEGAADSEEGSGSEEDGAGEVKPFSNLDLKEWYCFGIEHPKESSWAYLSQKSRTKGWNRIDVRALERSLQTNVDASYISLASFYLVDLDDETPYHCWFDNQNYLWNLEITDSPKADIDMGLAGEFFGSDLFKKIALRTEEILKRALEEYEGVVEWHLRNAELISVDETKLNTIVYLLTQKITLENIREGKWMKP